jgi:IclR family pca regulon transcriptional regulator
MRTGIDDSARPARASTYVQSLDRGLAVIRAFDGEHRRLTLTQVAANAGLPRAAARRFLLTPAQLGYVRIDGREFSLRPRVLDLGYTYLSALPLSQLVHRTSKAW